MIMKGASRSTISDLYRKKYKSELPERTFFACLNLDETGVCRKIDLKNMVLMGNEDQLSKITGMKERLTFTPTITPFGPLENKAAAPVHDQEIVEIQDPEVLNKETQNHKLFQVTAKQFFCQNKNFIKNPAYNWKIFG